MRVREAIKILDEYDDGSLPASLRDVKKRLKQMLDTAERSGVMIWDALLRPSTRRAISSFHGQQQKDCAKRRP